MLWGVVGSRVEFNDVVRRFGPALVRQRALQRLIEAGRSRLIEALKQVPIAVESHVDRRMSEAGLDDLGVLALGDQQGNVGVAQVMEPQGITHRGPHCRQEEPPTEGRPPQPGPVGRAKHIASDRRMLSEVLCEDVLKAGGAQSGAEMLGSSEGEGSAGP